MAKTIEIDDPCICGHDRDDHFMEQNWVRDELFPEFEECLAEGCVCCKFYPDEE